MQDVFGLITPADVRAIIKNAPHNFSALVSRVRWNNLAEWPWADVTQ